MMFNRFREKWAAEALAGSTHSIEFQKKLMKDDLCAGPLKFRAMQPVTVFPPRDMKGMVEPEFA
jgi:hypothetical protein